MKAELVEIGMQDAAIPILRNRSDDQVVVSATPCRSPSMADYHIISARLHETPIILCLMVAKHEAQTVQSAQHLAVHGDTHHSRVVLSGLRFIARKLSGLLNVRRRIESSTKVSSGTSEIQVDAYRPNVSGLSKCRPMIENDLLISPQGRWILGF
jgi:hypothetical protein